MLPERVSLTVTTLSVNRINKDELDHEAKNVERAAADFRGHVDVIGMGGAPLAYLMGPGSDLRMSKRVSEIAGIPAFYDITAVHQGLRVFDVHRVAIASPFTEEVNEPMQVFFEGAGFKVVSLVGGVYKTNAQLRRVPTFTPYQAGREALLRAPDAKALFINCSGWATQPCIVQLEQDFGVPVITQIAALVWHSLNVLGVASRRAGLGKLLSLPPMAVTQ